MGGGMKRGRERVREGGESRATPRSMEYSVRHPSEMEVKGHSWRGHMELATGFQPLTCALLSHRWDSLGPGEPSHVLDCGPRAHSHAAEPGGCRMGQLWATGHCIGCCHSADSGTHNGAYDHSVPPGQRHSYIVACAL